MKTQAKDLFARAQEFEREAREAFVESACGGDAELRLELQRLLVQAEKADAFFAGEQGETVTVEAFAGAGASERAGDTIGRYKLLQEIGEGGFGTVWMAEQVEPVSRRVALKIIKVALRETEARVAAGEEQQVDWDEAKRLLRRPP